ncbi:hypothetical protein [Polaribacter filamentus]
MLQKKWCLAVTISFWTIYSKKWFGASAEELQKYYKTNIRS